jgi:Tol biopolymer transport system component/DNA-binding winged helix-turn-helix (wHTH) protein
MSSNKASKKITNSQIPSLQDSNGGVYEFLDFRLDVPGRVLKRGDVPVPMTPKIFDALVLLVENAGKTVVKEEFLNRLWPDTVVEEANLTQNIFLLRKLLGEKESSRKIILTRSGVGYMFVPRVTRCGTVETDGISHQWRRRKKGVLIAGFAAAVLAFAGLTVRFYRGNRSVSPPIHKWELSARPGVESFPALSPDGTLLAFTWDGGIGGARANLYLQRVRTDGKPMPPVQQLTADSLDAACPAWSHDGHQIAFLQQGPSYAAIKTATPDGRNQRAIRELHPGSIDIVGCPAAFSPDNRALAIAVSAEDGKVNLTLVSLSSGEERPLTSSITSGVGDSSPAYSPDGKHFAFARIGDRSFADIYVAACNLSGTLAGEPRRLTNDGLAIHGIAWADSKSIIYSSTHGGVSGLWRISLLGGTPAFVPAGDLAQYPTISPHTGRLGFTILSKPQGIWQIPLSADGLPQSSPSALLTSTRKDAGPVLSPDGKLLAFYSDRTGTSEIWLSNPDGTHPRALTSFGGPFVGLSNWSPDGRTIAFDVFTRENFKDIYAVESKGGKPWPIVADRSSDFAPSWSKDGKWIFFASDRTGRHQIWRCDRQGKNLRQVTRAGGIYGLENDDGFLYYATDFVDPEICRVPTDGGPEETVLTEPRPGMFGQWTIHDGRIYFVHQSNRSRYDDALSSELWVHDLRAGKTKRLMMLPGPVPRFDPGLTVSPDGRRILYPQMGAASGNLYLIENFR